MRRLRLLESCTRCVQVELSQQTHSKLLELDIKKKNKNASMILLTIEIIFLH